MRLRLALALGILIGQLGGIFVPVTATAVGSSVMISSLQTASLAQASDEFIEIFNSGSAPVSVAGWTVWYRAVSSANGADCTKGWALKATLPAGASIPAGGHYLLTSTGYIKGDFSFNSGLASAGTVRIQDASKTTVDAVAWGAASCGIGLAAPAPAAGQSLNRRPGAQGLNSDNGLDFIAQPFPLAVPTTPSPTPTPVPTFTPTPTPTEAVSAVVATGPIGGLRLNELLVDPVAPQTDAADEFVELYNSGESAIEGGGYAIVSGTHKYVLTAGAIAPGSYVVLKSGQSNLSLANSGGVANLLDPTGNVVDTAGVWGAAVPGASWEFTDGTWRWSITPTPGSANIFTPVEAANTAEPVDYAPVELSELLPDPAPPLTDAKDEFIEIYNPTDQPVDLTGYILRTGHDLGSKAVISGVTVPPAGYVALKSADTKLALSNAGSSVALYTPDGVQLGLTITYPKAGTGNAWARLNGNWDWTSEPTPGAENVISPVALVPPKAAAVKEAKTVKASSAAKVKTPPKTKTAKVKAAKTTKPAAKPLLAGTTTTGGRWLLFILAGLTLAYIIYEFRYDIRDYYYKFRGYPGGRPSPVPVPVGRGDDRAGQRPGRR